MKKKRFKDNTTSQNFLIAMGMIALAVVTSGVLITFVRGLVSWWR